MLRYYFDSFDGQNWSRDEDGLECSDTDAVRKAAHAALTDLIRDEIPDGSHLAVKICVRDEHGPLLQTALLLSTDWLRPEPDDT